MNLLLQRKATIMTLAFIHTLAADAHLAYLDP